MATIFPIITKYMKLYMCISALILLPGIFSLFKYGLKLSIDFTGGSLVQIKLDADKRGKLDKDLVVRALGDRAQLVSITPVDSDSILLRTTQINAQQKDLFLKNLGDTVPGIVETRFETLGPILGKELVQKTVVAVLLSVTLIALYLGTRFASFQFGVGATLATLHDTLAILGIFSILGHFFGVEVDVLFVSAVLTILSFSVHDTIVVFDRIREHRRRKTNLSFTDLINRSALDTLSRSLRNSLAIIFMLLMVFLLTSGSLHWFILALLVGTIIGTYSSTCVALPILVVWERRTQGKN